VRGEVLNGNLPFVNSCHLPYSLVSSITNIRVIKNKKTGPHSESGLVYQFKRNGPNHNPRYRCSIETVIECGVTPISLAQLNSFKTFDVNANLASTIVIGWFIFHK